MDQGQVRLETNKENLFDVTHTFKIGSSTYHILGFNRDRPTYRNTFYICHCTDEQQHESKNKSSTIKRRVRAREKQTSNDDSTTHSIGRTKSVPAHSREGAESPEENNVDTTVMKKALTEAMRNERQLLVASFRKEMNLKKRTLLRSMKKHKEAILQATTEANKKDEIIHLLEEHNKSLAAACEQYANTTSSSIDTLKNTLIETLDEQHKKSQSVEQLQLTLMQTIEQEIKKITLKNEEILNTTSIKINAIHQLQNTLIQKLDDYSSKRTQNEDTTLKRLFNEQNQTLTNVVTQQQQQLSIDLIKQTMIDALNEQQSTSANMMNNAEYPQQSKVDIMPNLSSQNTLINSHNIGNKNVRNLSKTKSSSQFLQPMNRTMATSSTKIASKKPTDQNIFKVSFKSEEPAHLYAKLFIAGIEYSRHLHTLCQRDAVKNDIINCFIAPPATDGPYEVTIYAKTNKDTIYRAAITVRLPGTNISQPVTFPFVHDSFYKHQCILIEPFQRFLKQNQQVQIHMIVPGAHLVKIRNGDDYSELDEDEFKKTVVKKTIRVRGDISVIGCWDKKTDSTICVFSMV